MQHILIKITSLTDSDDVRGLWVQRVNSTDVEVIYDLLHEWAANDENGRPDRAHGTVVTNIAVRFQNYDASLANAEETWTIELQYSDGENEELLATIIQVLVI